MDRFSNKAKEKEWIYWGKSVAKYINLASNIWFLEFLEFLFTWCFFEPFTGVLALLLTFVYVHCVKSVQIRNSVTFKIELEILNIVFFELYPRGVFRDFINWHISGLNCNCITSRYVCQNYFSALLFQIQRL